MCSKCHALTELQKPILATELTNIQVKITLREKLKEIGKKGETYEHIIYRCIEAYENTLDKK